MKSDELFLRHILDEINFLLQQTQDMTYEQFLGDEVIKRASARSFEIIGEAAKNISADFKKICREIDWKGMAGLRDTLIHRYFQTNWSIIWSALKEKLPGLKLAIERALGDLRK
ncbi:MAG: DUF86 domain-containing protein [Candidatus Tectomicrobia bacterium]|uniref:DUF86 domain-containing protein n=1 Tax=Tectimicrobiota bacterium TaxID=2528274 RepID=A0A932I4G4_UNCTE|nr:DUF86 domain-containing protein [Candidatus Tectomicrobia bacterium]